MNKEFTPSISMDCSAHYKTQSALWGGPQFLRTRKRKGNVYRKPREPKSDVQSETFKSLILKALLA